MGSDPHLNHRKISEFSARDAERYPGYQALLDRVSEHIEPMMDMTPPRVVRLGLKDLWKFLRLGRAFLRLGAQVGDGIELLTGGDIFQGAMSLNQPFCFRPVPGFADYGSPIRGLYLCGAAAHPGGGVRGTAGRNAARAILARSTR